MLGNLVDVWYPGPTEVKYLIVTDKIETHIGIAYHDTIIDLESGIVMNVQDVLYDAIENGIHTDDAIVEWCEWIPIKEPRNWGLE